MEIWNRFVNQQKIWVRENESKSRTWTLWTWNRCVQISEQDIRKKTKSHDIMRSVVFARVIVQKVFKSKAERWVVGVMHLFVFLYITLKQNLMVSLNTLSWLDIINLQSFWVKPTDVESDLMSCTYCNIFSVKRRKQAGFFHMTEVILSLHGGSKIRHAVLPKWLINMHKYCI